MKKFKELKDYVKEHIPQVIAAVAGIIAVLLVGAIVIISISGGKEDENRVASTEKPAYEITLETTLKIEDNRETTTEQIEATTKEEKTTTKKESKEEKSTEATNSKEPISQETTRKQEQASTSTQVTTTKAQTVVQPTTKKQEATTKKQETTTASVVRGKNGVILEELSFDRWNYSKRVHESVSVPKTYTEYKNNASSENAIGYAILYDDYKIRDDIFYNELTFKNSTEQDIINIYGKPLTKYSTANGEFLVYRYGYYASSEEDIIYIRFGIAYKLDNKFGSVGIGNANALGLEKYLK